jgi:hypothetical protein
LHQIRVGESLWAFTRKNDGRYALAAELIITAKTMNPSGFRYGPYRVWGDLQRSRYFAIEEQPDISVLIRSLDTSCVKHTTSAGSVAAATTISGTSCSSVQTIIVQSTAAMRRSTLVLTHLSSARIVSRLSSCTTLWWPYE